MTITFTEQDVGRAEHAVTDAYLRMRRRQDEAIRHASNDFAAGAKVLARRLLEAQISPYNYLQFIWEKYSLFTHRIHEYQVLSENNVNEYLKNRAKNEAYLRMLVSLQYKTLEREVKRGRSLHDILLDTRLELSAVFRFAVACAGKEDELRERFREQAEEMLLFEPLYKRLLKHALPEELQA